MKDGTSYVLKEPPQFKSGRIVFTTIDGNVLSVKQDDVQSIGVAPKPTSTPSYDIEDSRALGAITRDERNRAGKEAEIAPKPTHKPSVTPKKRTPTKTPTPKPKS
jgi:hypothetical protein